MQAVKGSEPYVAHDRFSGPAVVKRLLRGMDAMGRAVEARANQVEMALRADDVAKIKGR